MKTVIIALLLAVSSNAYALRCGNSLISIGDPVFKVQKACPIEGEYRVNNQNADILKLYYSVGSMNYELTFIDGKLNNIEEGRF